MPDSSSIIESAQEYNIIEIINKGLAYAIIAAGFLCIVFIFVGGISFILSGGDEGKIKQAIGTIRYAIIGLVITIFSVVLVALVGNVLGLNIIKYINFSDIIQNVSNLSSGENLNSSNSSGSLD